MYFSKDGEKFFKYGLNGEKFTKAKESAIKSLRIEDGQKFYYKETEAATPLIFVHKVVK